MTDGRTDRQTDGQTDICDSRVAFATENGLMTLKLWPWPILITLNRKTVAEQDLNEFEQKIEKFIIKMEGLNEKMVLYSQY